MGLGEWVWFASFAASLMKQFLKKISGYLPFYLTKNQRYDAQTKRVIESVCHQESNCIDVGCHRGEILELMLKAAPGGQHFGFEPIPALFEFLMQKFGRCSNVSISDLALSNEKGIASFNYVVSNPSYSGLKKRRYDRANEEDTSIHVQTEKLDHAIPENIQIDLLKIDVEGAEMLVLQGGVELLKRCKPVVIFEYGLGASDVYGSTPETTFQFFETLGYKIALLSSFLKNRKAFTEGEFAAQYHRRRNHYFVAFPD